MSNTQSSYWKGTRIPTGKRRRVGGSFRRGFQPMIVRYLQFKYVQGEFWVTAAKLAQWIFQNSDLLRVHRTWGIEEVLQCPTISYGHTEGLQSVGLFLLIDFQIPFEIYISFSDLCFCFPKVALKFVLGCFLTEIWKLVLLATFSCYFSSSYI